jgi:hypothetical protein
MLRSLLDLDKSALQAAVDLAARMPRGDNTVPQLPVETAPLSTDLTILSRPQNVPGGGVDYSVSLATLTSFFGSGGGISFAYNSNLTSMTIYNYGQYTGAPNGTAVQNTTALANMFGAILSAVPVGGRIWLPAYPYQVNSSPTGLLVPYCVVMEGLGTGGINQSGGQGAFNFIINGTGSGSPGNIFFNLTGAHNSGGTIFRNLSFNWIGSTDNYDTCINMNAAWNAKVEDCFFNNCPTALNCDSLASGMLSSSIKYQAGSPNNAVSVILQAPEAYAVGPGEYNQDSVNLKSGPTNCVAVMVCGGPPAAEHCVVKGLHLADYSYGVCFNTGTNVWSGTPGWPTAALQSGSQMTLIHDIECAAYITAVYIQPATGAGTIYSTKVSDSILTKSRDSLDGHAIALIDTNSGINSNVADIEFHNTSIFSNVLTSSGGGAGVPQHNQYGLQIIQGSAIGVFGCKISNMGTAATTQVDGTANVAITGAVGAVNLEGTYLGPITNNAAQQRPSQWGLLITGSITLGPITVNNCYFGSSLWGASGPVSVTGTISSGALYITNCPGYNDQSTVINTHANIATSAYAAYNQGLNSGTSYYGPSYVFYVSSGSASTLSINGGAALSLTASTVGFFWLNSPYDTFLFSVAPTSIQWVGK